MQNLAARIIQVNTVKAMDSSQPKTPREAGNRLFQNLMKKLNGESSQGDDLIGFFQDITTAEKLIRGSGEKQAGTESVEKFLQTLEKLGVNRGQFKLKAASIPSLISFLQQQNISREEIARLLASLKNKDGTINLDRLWSQIYTQVAGANPQEKGMVIQASDVPRLEAFLFQCGLGVGEVKAVVEKSINPKGHIAVARLASQLSSYLAGDHSESRLKSVLAQLGIQTRAAELDLNPLKSSWAELLKERPPSGSSSLPDQIKQELAAFLRDRGLPPEEVRSFLEALSLKSGNVKASLPLPDQIKQELAAFLRDKGLMPEEVKSFLETLSLKSADVKAPSPHQLVSTPWLDGVIVSGGKEWQGTPWQEQILRIMQGDPSKHRRAVHKKGVSPGDPPLNQVTPPRDGDRDVKSELFHKLVQGKKTIPEQGEVARIIKDITEKNRGQIRVQEPLGFEAGLKKTEINATRIEPLAPVGQDRNLRPPLPGILERMVFMIRGGIQRSRLTINPPGLGRIDLDLSIRHGHLRAHLGAESLMVKELIEANLNQLRQQLSNQGLVVEKFEVTLGLNDQKSAENRNGPPDGKRFPKPTKGPRTVAMSGVAEEDRSDQPIAGFYQVDVRV